MNIGPAYWRLVAIAAAMIVARMLWRIARDRPNTPAAERRRSARAAARAQSLLASKAQHRGGTPHA